VELTNKTILVTGGAGVIGKELITRLTKLTDNIFCIDRVGKPQQFTHFDHLCYIQKDLNAMNIRDIIKLEPAVIFHLAATFERTEETPEFWEENYKDNILASHFVLESAKRCPTLERFVFTSSYLVYDQNQYLFAKPQKNMVKLTESSRIKTRNLCGASKYYTENELSFLEHVKGFDFNSISARIFRVYGIQSRDFLSRSIRAGLRGEPIELYRKEGLFDYIYAGDVAEGLVYLATANITGPVNLGFGKAQTVETAISLIKENITKLDIVESERDVQYEASCSDITLLKKVTCWQPTISLEEGLKKIIAYEQSALKKR